MKHIFLIYALPQKQEFTVTMLSCITIHRVPGTELDINSLQFPAPSKAFVLFLYDEIPN